MLRKNRKNPRKALCSALSIFILFAMPCVTTFAQNMHWDGYVPPPAGFYRLSDEFDDDNGFFDWENLFPPLPERVPAWQSTMLTDEVFVRRMEGLEIRGTIPSIDGAFDAAPAINEHVMSNVVMPLVGEARRLRARSVTLSFEYHATSDVVSIVIYADVATALPHRLVRSINFCTFDGTLLTMNEAVSMVIAPLAERILAERIRSNPERYYAALSASPANQAFFIENGILQILFDGFRLSTRYGGVDNIEIVLYNVNVIVLTAEDYLTDESNGMKMIPLRDVMVYQFGYQVRWSAYDKSTVISRDGLDIIRLRAGDNEYIVFETQRRSLEAAPQLIDGYTHVPITFFDQVLPLTTYTIEADGSIVFLAYRLN